MSVRCKLPASHLMPASGTQLPRTGRRMAKKKDIVQVRNPRSGHFVKIDRSEGKIIDHKKTSGAYKNVPIARKSSKKK